MSSLDYRPAIDGLRAVAVLSVLIFHLDSRFLRGGFLGVDVFFVLSGYLITSIIVSESESHRFSYARFYQRRISRIFPAFFLVAAAVLVGAYFVYAPQDFASAGEIVSYAALSAANMKMMRQGDYFQISKDAEPMLHFWSLAVEEQFYLVLPLFIWMAYQLKASRRYILGTLIIGGMISFSACVVMTVKRPIWAFYLLPTRAWELIAGSALSLFRFGGHGNETSAINRFLSNIGLVLIVVSLFLVQEGAGFPGYIAGMPVIGTVLFIGLFCDAKSISERLLSFPLPVFIGRASYSLYLWHWPIYCFVDYSMYTSSFALRTSLKILLTVLCALTSYFAYERPVRGFLNRPAQARMAFATFVAGTILLASSGYLIRVDNYVNARFSAVKDGGITFNSAPNRPNVVLMGDSNGSMYGTTAREIATKLGFELHVISVTTGVPFPGSDFFRDSMLCLERQNPGITIFAAAWAQRVGDDLPRLEAALTEILRHSKHLIVITQPPVLPKYASRDEIRKSGVRPVFEDDSIRSMREQTNRFLIAKANDRIHVLDIEDLFRKLDGEIKFTNDQGQQLFHDSTHLSEYGSDLVRARLFAEIARILAAEPSCRDKTQAVR